MLGEKPPKMTSWGKTPSYLLFISTTEGVLTGILYHHLGYHYFWDNHHITSCRIHPKVIPPSPSFFPTPRPLQVGSMSRETKRPFCVLEIFSAMICGIFLKNWRHRRKKQRQRMDGEHQRMEKEWGSTSAFLINLHIHES